MLHEPAAQSGHDPAAPSKARAGLWMFFIYLVFYAGFVAINLWRPLWMASEAFLGMNLATVYGFALILGAFVQAIIYNAMCRSREKAYATEGAAE